MNRFICAAKNCFTKNVVWIYMLATKTIIFYLVVTEKQRVRTVLGVTAAWHRTSTWRSWEGASTNSTRSWSAMSRHGAARHDTGDDEGVVWRNDFGTGGKARSPARLTWQVAGWQHEHALGAKVPSEQGGGTTRYSLHAQQQAIVC
jgi:hypothetical protein